MSKVDPQILIERAEEIFLGHVKNNAYDLSSPKRETVLAARAAILHVAREFAAAIAPRETSSDCEDDCEHDGAVTFESGGETGLACPDCGSVCF